MLIFLLTSLLVLLVMLVVRGKKWPSPAVRPLSAFQDLQSEIGYAAESEVQFILRLAAAGYMEKTRSHLWQGFK